MLWLSARTYDKSEPITTDTRNRDENTNCISSSTRTLKHGAFHVAKIGSVSGQIRPCNQAVFKNLK